MNFETWYDKYYDQLREDWLKEGGSINLKSWAREKFKGRDDE